MSRVGRGQIAGPVMAVVDQKNVDMEGRFSGTRMTGKASGLTGGSNESDRRMGERRRKEGCRSRATGFRVSREAKRTRHYYTAVSRKTG